MRTKISSYLIALTFTFFSFSSVFGQKAFLGGGGNAMMPIVNYNDWSYASTIMGGHTGQVKYVVASSDGNKVYFETIDNFSSEKKIHQLDAGTESYGASTSLRYGAQDLGLTDNGDYLFFHASTILYKLNTSTMQLADSITLPNIITHIEVFDQNTVFCNSITKTYEADFINHSYTDSVTNDDNLEMMFNAGKTKLYTLRASPNELVVMDVNPLSIDTSMSLSGTIGFCRDVVVDDNYIYIFCAGSSNNGTVRILNINDYSLVTDISVPMGSGYMNIAPNNKLWVPSSTSGKISIIDIATTALDTVLTTQNYNNFTGPFTVAFSSSIISGLEDINEENSLMAFPNPSNGIITLKGNTQLSSIKVYDTMGKLLYAEKGIISTTIDLSKHKGLLIIEAVDNTGKEWTEKLIIK